MKFFSKLGPAAAAAIITASVTLLAGQAPPATNPALLNPAALTEQSPAKWVANFTTSAGNFQIEVHRDWAPNGADRFYNLVKNGFYDNVRFFRVIKGFMAQFGINGDPAVNAAWAKAFLPPDPRKQNNRAFYVSYAMGQTPDTRTTQVFINYVDNDQMLDRQGFAPFGQVYTGQDVLQQLYGDYGERPEQPLIQAQGNAYLMKSFPRLDYVKTAKVK